MELNDITNLPSTARLSRSETESVHVRLPKEFAPSKRYNLHTTQQRRNAGHTNVDLWVDSCLYPNDPLTNVYPTFNSLPTFLQYVGRGEQGLLGYCKRLSTIGANSVQWWMHQHRVLLQNIATLQQRIIHVEKEAQTLQQHVKDKDGKIEKLEGTILRLKETPLGARERKRKFSAIETLAPKGGARKKRVTATRNFIQETCGSQNQEDRVHLLSSCLKKADVIALLRAPRGKHINDAVTKEVMRKFSNLVTAVDVQKACDEVGISTKGYIALHGLLKDALRERGITENVFPVPRKVNLARRVSNEDVC